MGFKHSRSRHKTEHRGFIIYLSFVQRMAGMEDEWCWLHKNPKMVSRLGARGYSLSVREAKIAIDNWYAKQEALGTLVLDRYGNPGPNISQDF